MSKNNVKKQGNPMKKLIASAGMLSVSAVMLASSTYAWFSMNKTVTVTGMSIKTTVGSNLLISHDSDISAKTKNEDSTFKTTDNTTINAWLQPVSSNDGKATNFWYTVDADASGKKQTGASYIDYDDNNSGGLSALSGDDASTYGNRFSKDYGVDKSIVNDFVTDSSSAYRDKAVGYVDYVFQLKATNSSANTEGIYLTQLDLTYGGANDTNLAYRTAVFVEEYGSDQFNNAGGTTLNAIYKPSTATYYEAGTSKAVGTSSGGNTAELKEVSNLVSSATPLATVNSGDTKYYKVVVRLWLEGEDTTCTNKTFARLTSSWALDLRLDLGELTDSNTKVNGNTVVTAINMKQTTGSGNG